MEAITEYTPEENDVTDVFLYISDDYDHQESMESMMYYGFIR